MIGLGTVVNAAAIICGGAAGTFVKNGLSQRFRNILMEAIGLSVLIIGFSGAMQGILKIAGDGKLDRVFTMEMIFSLVIGGLIGEALNIEQKLDNMGQWFQSRFARNGGNFAQGFVTASLVYCVGAMAIVGALEDGLSGNTGTLFAKSILDGVSAIVFAATMGVGVAFSCLPVLIYQGFITLMAGLIKPWLTDTVITQMSLVGSVLILAIGINLLDIRKIKVGNLLPAIFLPLVYYIVIRLFS